MAEIPQLEECTIVGVFGPVSSGKSFLLEQWFNRMIRAIYVDSTFACRDEQMAEHIWGNPQQLAMRLKQNEYHYRIAYHPKNAVSGYYWCGNMIWQCQQPRWIIVDEVHQTCARQSVDDTMDTMIRYARHNFLGVIGATQRIADVDRLFTDNSRMTILFYTEESASLDAIQDRWGRVVRDEVSHLRPCIYRDDTKQCLQHPECVVLVRGRGYRVVALGDLVYNSTDGEQEQWHSGQQQQMRQQLPSSDSSSGDLSEREESSPEDTSSPEEQ